MLKIKEEEKKKNKYYLVKTLRTQQVVTGMCDNHVAKGNHEKVESAM